MSEQVARNPGLFNPERPQALVARYNNMIQKGRINSIRVLYSATGVEVMAERPAVAAQAARDGTPAVPARPAQWVSLAEATQREVAASSDQHNLSYWRNKFEDRLDIECPVGWGNSGADEAIQSSINQLPFVQRRALRMSNAQFAQHYPNGFVNGAPAVVAVAGAPQGN